MALPRITHPIYSTILPSTGKKISFRGFLAKEEKILLLAVQGQDQDQMNIALKQILTNCTIENIDVSKLVMPDVEWLYLQIITKSLGEELELNVSCGNCEEEINYKLALNEIIAPVITKRANIIEIDKGMYITLKYPTLDTLNDLDVINEVHEIQSAEAIFEAIASNIESISTGEEVFHLKDSSEEEILEWFDGLSSTQLTLITDFFANIPTIEEKIEFVCKCGYKNEYGIRGISELFM